MLHGSFVVTKVVILIPVLAWVFNAHKVHHSLCSSTFIDNVRRSNTDRHDMINTRV